MSEDRAFPGLFAAPGPVFEAKYCGKCGLCDHRFSTGTRIHYIAKKTLAHAACAVPSGRGNSTNEAAVSVEELADDLARANMRSQKPSTWRLGRSPSDYG